MKWTEEIEPRERRVVMRHGVHMQLAVEYDDAESWQHFSLSFGVFAKDRTFSECLESWPREAIAEARRRLDEFEAAADSD